MYISKLKLYNFKSFKGIQEFKFTEGKNFIVGNNNVGKTSIFEAIDFLFNGLKRNQEIDELLNNDSKSESVYVEATYSDISDLVKSVSKLQPYITTANTLTLKRGNNISIINTKGKQEKAHEKTLAYQRADTGLFYNPTGISNATKPFFDPTIIYANDHNENYQDFKSSGLLGKLLKLEAKNLLDSDKFKDVQQKFNDLIEQNGGLQDHLNEVKEFMEQAVSSQFGKVGLDFQFKIPEMDSIIKNGRVLAEDKNGKQDISEKGSGLQRAVVLAVVQAYSNFAKKADSMQFLIDEPELYMHPLAQDNLLNALDELSEGDNQIFLNTHSPYILRHFNSDRDSVVILSNVTGENRVRQMEALIFRPTSIGEITYKAFGVPTVDLHQRLYSIIENKVIYEDNAGIEKKDKNRKINSETAFSDYLDFKYKNILKHKRFRPRYTKNSKNGGWIPAKNNVPLPFIVRNEIDHPDVYLEDETGTNNFNEDDLKESIDELFKIYQLEFKA